MYPLDVNKRRELCGDQFCDGRSRDQDARIDAHLMPCKPRHASQIGGGHPFFDAPLHERTQLPALREIQHGLIGGRRIGMAQSTRVEHQRSRFIPWVVGAMTKSQLRTREATGRLGNGIGHSGRR